VTLADGTSTGTQINADADRLKAVRAGNARASIAAADTSVVAIAHILRQAFHPLNLVDGKHVRKSSMRISTPNRG
jgi:hypothetical protein